MLGDCKSGSLHGKVFERLYECPFKLHHQKHDSDQERSTLCPDTMDDDTIVELQGVIDKLEDLITESCVNLNEVLFFISPVESEVLNTNRGPMVGDLVARAVYDSFHLVH